MKCKLEKPENANEVKLELTVEAQKFSDAIQKYTSKVLNILIYQDLEKEKHQ